MDPVALIMTALEAGAASAARDEASDAVKDAFGRLREAIRGKLAGYPGGDTALEANRQTGQAPLMAELARAGAGNDTDLVAAAFAVMELVDAAGARAGKYAVTVSGSHGTQTGDRNTQVNHYHFYRGDVDWRRQPPTHVVDAWGRGDFTTVSAAVAVACSGDRIMVRPGLYKEGLVVDKPLEILGDGPTSEIEIRAYGARVLLFRASIGRVANLTLRQAGGGAKWYGVDIIQGRLDLEDCDISAKSRVCVAIRDGADPRLRRNQIHDADAAGVYVKDGGLGMLEDNVITGNRGAGVEIKNRGNPTLRRNQIHGNEAGVLVWGSGLGTLEDNDITGNEKSGVTIKDGGSPVLRRNRVNRNGYQGVRIYSGGRGVLEDNNLTSNVMGAMHIAQDCRADVTRARNTE